MFQVAVGRYEARVLADGLPDDHEAYHQHAVLVDQFDLLSPNGAYCFVGVGRPGEWPTVVVEQRYSPTVHQAFPPGMLIAPDSDRLFVGAGTRLLCYDLSVPARLWADTCDTGFWGWAQFGDYILMSAELELAA